MTKRLDPVHPQDALYAAARTYPGGVKALAIVRDVSVETMYQKLDRQNPKNRIGFDDELFSLLDQLRAAGVATWDDPVAALAHQCGGVYVRLPEAPADMDAPAAALAVTAIREFSELMTEFTADANAGINDAALGRLEKEGNEALRAIQLMLSWARQEHDRRQADRGSLKAVA